MPLLDRLRRLMPSREAMEDNRWLRWLGPSLLHPRVWHLSRRGVALGAAVGVFFAFITPVAQIPLSATVCVLVRCNLPAAVVGTLVNTPPTFGPVYYGAWKLGSWILDEPADEAHTPSLLAGRPPVVTGTAPAEPAGGQPWWQRWGSTLAEVGKPLLVGTVIFAVGSSALVYVLVAGIWRWRVRSQRRRRLATLENRA